MKESQLTAEAVPGRCRNGAVELVALELVALELVAVYAPLPHAPAVATAAQLIRLKP